MKREAVNIGLNGIGAFFIDALLKKGLNQAIENPKIKPFIPLITILPIYIATEFVSRWIYPVADAIDSEVHAHQQPLMPLTFPEDKADVAISTHNSRDIHLSQWQRFHSQHMSPSVVYQA
jgi:hypothetical protein